MKELNLSEKEVLTVPSWLSIKILTTELDVAASQRTECFQLGESLVDASSQFGPLGKLILRTCLQ